MTKTTAFIFCAVLAAGAVFLREVQHRAEIRTLRTAIQILEAGRDQLSHSESATPRLTNLTEETKGPEAGHDQSSRQILRLRNQVALLLKSNEQAEKIIQEKGKLIQSLGQLKGEERKAFI